MYAKEKYNKNQTRNTTKYNHTKQIKNSRIWPCYTAEKIFKTFQTAKIYDIIFTVIPHSYHSFRNKVLLNV